jgi:hypothetical protein
VVGGGENEANGIYTSIFSPSISAAAALKRFEAQTGFWTTHLLTTAHWTETEKKRSFIFF